MGEELVLFMTMMVLVKFIQMREGLDYVIEVTMALLNRDCGLSFNTHYNFQIIIKWPRMATQTHLVG